MSGNPAAAYQAHLAAINSINQGGGGGGGTGGPTIAKMLEAHGLGDIKDTITEMIEAGSIPCFLFLKGLTQCGLMIDKEVNSGLKLPSPTPSLTNPSPGLIGAGKGKK